MHQVIYINFLTNVQHLYTRSFEIVQRSHILRGRAAHTINLNNVRVIIPPHAWSRGTPNLHVHV